MSIEEIKKNFYKNKKITQFNIDEYRNEYIKHLEQTIQSQVKEIDRLEGANEYKSKRIRDLQANIKGRGKTIDELKQKLKESDDKNKLTTKLLRDLLEFQNGAPLIQYKDEFEKTEHECWDIVNKNENNL